MSLPRAFNILYVDNGLLMKEWPAFETDELVAWRKTTNTYSSLKLKSTTVSYIVLHPDLMRTPGSVSPTQEALSVEGAMEILEGL